MLITMKRLKQYREQYRRCQSKTKYQLFSFHLCKGKQRD
jgi:hypothetical protein